MTRSRRLALWSTLAALGAHGAAHAEPGPTTVRGCSFDAAALAAALAAEHGVDRPPLPPITVTCAAGSATVAIDHPDQPPTVRVVDLIDVPAPLAPRVVALVAVAAAHEPPAPPPPPPEPPEPPAPARVATTPPTTPTRTTTPTPVLAPPTTALRRVPDRGAADLPPLPARRTVLADGLGRRPLGVAARGLARVHDGTTTLWGAGAALTLGATSLGLTAAGARVDHALGRLTPWLLAVEAGVTVACAGAACVALRGELGRLTVTATASDPMTVAARALAATYLHGAIELSLAARVRGLDVAAVGGLGSSRGVVARVDADAAVVLAGWTFTGGLEVRR